MLKTIIEAEVATANSGDSIVGLASAALSALKDGDPYGALGRARCLGLLAEIYDPSSEEDPVCQLSDDLAALSMLEIFREKASERQLSVLLAHFAGEAASDSESLEDLASDVTAPEVTDCAVAALASLVLSHRGNARINIDRANDWLDKARGVLDVNAKAVIQRYSETA